MNFVKYDKKMMQKIILYLANGQEVLCEYHYLRIDKDSIPEGKYCYSVRADDNGEDTPATVEYGVLVNHWGDIVTDEKINIPDNTSYLPITDWDFNC